MSYIDKAFEEAKKAGWKPKDFVLSPIINVTVRTNGNPEEIAKVVRAYIQAPSLLDPLFWQALGKARGWKEYMYNDGIQSDRPDRQYASWTLTWKHYWHCFIDHLAEGKSAEEFFATL